MRPSRRALGVGSVLLVGIALAAGAAEIALRTLDLPREHPVGWAWRGDAAERNELGFRGHRASGSVADTIMLAGDSQVETTQPFGRMPEVFLSAALRELTGREVRVLSVGVTGWGQDQQLLALRRDLPRVRPRMVLLWFTPANDFWNNTFPTHMPRDGWPKPTFWLEGDALRGPHAEWGDVYRAPGPRLLRAWRRILGRPMYVTDAEWEAKLPPAYQRAPMTTPVRSLAEFSAEQLGVSVATVTAASAGENFDNEKTHASTALVPRSPRLTYSIRLTRALLGEIARLCREHGATFLLFYIDTRPYTNLPEEATPFEIDGTVVTLSGAAQQAVIRETVAGLPHLVLTGYGPNVMTSRLDSHLNDDGNRFFMAELARRIAGQLRPQGSATSP